MWTRIDILHGNAVVIKLSQFDTPTADDGKFTNFYKLGICLGGFGKKRIPQKARHRFCREPKGNVCNAIQNRRRQDFAQGSENLAPFKFYRGAIQLRGMDGYVGQGKGPCFR